MVKDLCLRRQDCEIPPLGLSTPLTEKHAEKDIELTQGYWKTHVNSRLAGQTANPQSVEQAPGQAGNKREGYQSFRVGCRKDMEWEEGEISYQSLPVHSGHRQHFSGRP